MGKHCTGELRLHQLLQRSEMNRCDPDTWKSRQISLQHHAFSLSVEGIKNVVCVDVDEHRHSRKQKTINNKNTPIVNALHSDC